MPQEIGVSLCQRPLAAAHARARSLRELRGHATVPSVADGEAKRQIEHLEPRSTGRAHSRVTTASRWSRRRARRRRPAHEDAVNRARRGVVLGRRGE
jgi:hypothetical protein